MARKSRNASTVDNAVFSVSAKFLVGGYIRLSTKNSGTGKEDTIENQKAAIFNYISNQPDMCLVDIYCDNGETGTDFDRPDFERMMADIGFGKINCVVVKDLSRFGRNYLEAGLFLEQDFPRRGVRFVSIQESIDTLHRQSTADNCILPLKNILNDYYAKDISMKTGSALLVKQRQGAFIGSWAAYGYQKDPNNKHKLMIDEETAAIVKQIFAWKLQGKGYSWIVGELTRQAILSPSAYRYKIGIHKAEKMKNVPWRTSTLKEILTNEVYLGHIVQGRRRGLLYLGQHSKRLPSQDWIIVRNTHDPIIDQSTFDQVQELRAVKTKAYQERLEKIKGKTTETKNLFHGLLFCGCCKTKLIRHKNRNQNSGQMHIYYSFLCPKHAVGCTFTSITEKGLLTAVYKVLHTQIALAADVEAALKELRKTSSVKRGKNQTQHKIETIEKSIKEREHLRRCLFENMAKGKIDEANYIEMQLVYQSEIETYKMELKRLKADSSIPEDGIEQQNMALQAFISCAGIESLSAEITHALLQKIVIDEDQTMHITFSFIDVFHQIAVSS